MDLLLAEHGLIIEADGRVKYTGDELWAEKRRETRLRALGYRVERLLWEDVVHRWAETRRRLRLTLRLPADVVGNPVENQPHQAGRRIGAL